MNLREYLFHKRITVKSFSETLECTRIHLSEIINGRRKAGRRLAKEIEKLTDGEVKAEDLMRENKEK